MKNFTIQKALPFALSVIAVMLGDYMSANASVPGRLAPHMSAADPAPPQSEALRAQDILAEVARALPVAPPSSFDEWDMARPSSRPPANARCVSSLGAITCFYPDGDRIWVYDSRADGASAVAAWVTDYGRSGVCRNALGKGRWAVCNKNFREGRRIAMLATQYDGNTNRFVGGRSIILVSGI